jgi:hypothetical protein
MLGAHAPLWRSRFCKLSVIQRSRCTAELTAALAQVDSPFFGAHPISVSVLDYCSTRSLQIYFSNIVAFFFGKSAQPTYAVTPSQPAPQQVAQNSAPQQPVVPVATSPKTSPIVQNTYPVIEHTTTVEHVVSGISEEMLTSQLTSSGKILSLKNSTTRSAASRHQAHQIILPAAPPTTSRSLSTSTISTVSRSRTRRSLNSTVLQRSGTVLRASSRIERLQQ